ncbi:GDSL-type esterase/lipase family protein [Variovorax sp. dw_954]|uniref:GDSL-type esterase/lipase family protein n=1 Tax=Variovorax sp. dw_954 TaxID=2720078 RepID=UPI001BD35CE7|nr:GDSL-type esterase/lipase family protein [Variovorax sp. dw_954]
MSNVFWGVHTALQAGAPGSVLMIGDSWWWYPIDNLATEIGALFASESFVVIGRNGAEAAEWSQGMRKTINLGFDMYARGCKVLMLSGGGNDVAGQDDFLRLLNTNCSAATTVKDCFALVQPDAVITGIMNAYREVIVRFRAHNKTAPVVMHNYDNAWPTGQGFFGPGKWLKVPMDIAQVPEQLRRDVFKSLVNKLHLAQVELAKEASLGPLVAVLTAGELPEAPGSTDEQWLANELHPTPKGFKRIAKNRLRDPLDQFLLG